MRSIVIAALLASTASAAPRLKPEKPALPAPEDDRIEALRAKYDALRVTADRAERARLAAVRITVEHRTTIYDRLSLDGEAAASVEAALHQRHSADPVMRDHYDIAMYDRARKKAGGDR